MSIILNQISKSFNQQLIVNAVDLKIDTGELFVLLGASGSGKSTILRLIAGLLTADSGQILLNDQDVTNWPVQKRNIGFVFQNYAIFNHLSVYGNVEFGLRVRGVPKLERRIRADELLELAGLTGLGDRQSMQLSGGQRQRVALARALAYNPKVLLLDEPFGALDVHIRAQLRSSLRAIQQKLKITTILVTHDQQEAFELGDRIGVFQRGHLVEVGSAAQIYHRPKSEFAATFVGASNLLVGRVRASLDGVQQIALGQIKLSMPANAPEHDEGAPVRVLFRPEDVVCQQTEFIGQSKVLPLGQGKVVRQVFSGAHMRIQVEVPSLVGVRQIAPQASFGQRLPIIEANAPALSFKDGPIEEKNIWVGISNVHVLKPSGLHFLVLNHAFKNQPVATVLGTELVKLTHGRSLILEVNPSKNAKASTQITSHSGAREIQVRSGSLVHETIRQAQSDLYDIFVMDSTSSSSSAAEQTKAETLVRRMIAHINMPVLVAQKAWHNPANILVCTAGGEPGKSDVLLAARLSRYIDSPVTVLHALRPNATRAEEERILHHLEQSCAVLQSVGIDGRYMLKRATPLEGIVAASNELNSQLVIVGAPGGNDKYVNAGADFIKKLIVRSNRNILIVPSSQD